MPRLTFQTDRDLGEFDEYEFVALSSSEEEDINKIDITVRNNLIIPLGRITIDLIDDISTDTIGTVEFNEEIPPGGSGTSRLDLAGKTFTNDLSIFIDAETPEATVDLGEPDLLESSFVVETFITALQVDSASAKIPQQEFDGSTTINVPDIFVTRAVIGSGSISLEIANRLPIDVERFIVQFPDFEKDGAVLSVDLSFERNVTRTQNIVLDNTVFTPLQSDAIRVQWDVSTEDTGEEFRTLSRGDFVTVTSEPSKIIFDEVSGKPDGIEVEIPETKKEDIDIPDGLDNVEFETASFVLSFFKNNGPFGLPLSLDLTVKGTNKGGDEGFLIIDETIGPGDTTLTVQGPDVAAFLNLLPTDVEASGMALLGDGFTEVTINKDDVVSGRFTFSTPLILTITDTTRIKVAPEDVSIDDEDARNKIRENVISVSMVADVDNALPLGIGVQINIAHDTTKIFSGPELVIPKEGPIVVEAAQEVDPETGRHIPVSSHVEFTLNKKDIDIFTKLPIFSAVLITIPKTDGRVAVLNTDQVQIRARAEIEILIDEDLLETK